MEWLAVFLFALLVASSVASETIWLVRRGWTTFARAVAFVLVTDLLALALSSAVAFAAASAIFVMVMGPAGTGSDAPEWAYILAAAIAVLAPAILLFLLKLGLLHLLKIRSGRPAVLYSAVLAVLIPVIVLVPPVLFVYMLSRGR